MRAIGKFALAGVATLGIAGAVVAAERNVHSLKVALPDGSIGEIRYVGDVAPRVVMAPIGFATIADDASPFAAIDRMFAELDAQADAMVAQAAAAHASAAGATPAAAGAHPAGNVVSYSFVSTSGGRSGGCVQSYQMTSYGGQQAPKVVSQQSGDCKGVRPLVPTAMTADPAAAKSAPSPVASQPFADKVKAKPPIPISDDAHVI